ncbi:hypothetical protein GQS52_03570 [Streptomyces sp. SCUT-3]|uniref:hypothetical protein n=1 Tax=Streptomyces sp. SCUT-3 TaxID=2684469 RepID=UPI0015FBA643|nr:hypothetical protein [Streptomyces sp. SCUT-3]QMV21012.1 hypothetical protein GQS52_03570 [Streptomyces sp. SCUT-3]
MSAADRMTMNALLADPDRVDVAELVQDGRIGLFVVATLAAATEWSYGSRATSTEGPRRCWSCRRNSWERTPGPPHKPPRPPPGRPRPPPPPSPERPRPRHAPSAPAPLTPHTPSAHRGAIPADDATGGTDAPGPAVSRPSRTGRSRRRTLEPPPGGRHGHLDAPDDTTLHTVLRGDPDPEHGPVHGGRSTGGRPADGPPPLPHRPGPLPSVVPPRPPAVSPAPRPVAETVRGTGTGDRPRLPRRRRQEHPAPQPRHQLPAARPAEEYVGHDPGLMAAFRRGVSLADEPDTDTP